MEILRDEEIHTYLREIAKAYHFDDISCWQIEKKNALTTYPDAWQQEYIQNNYDQTDYTLLKPLKAPAPLLWGDKLSGKLKKEKRKVFEKAQNFGIVSGITMPVFDHKGIKSLHTFSSQNKQHKLEHQIAFSFADQYALAYVLDQLIDSFHQSTHYGPLLDHIDQIVFFS